jgi:hypothetical protein
MENEYQYVEESPGKDKLPGLKSKVGMIAELRCESDYARTQEFFQSE